MEFKKFKDGDIIHIIPLKPGPVVPIWNHSHKIPCIKSNAECPICKLIKEGKIKGVVNPNK